MAGYVVVGTQWGDEGKGKVVDLLGTHMDMVVRFQGGNNAGHTVVVGDKKVILRLLPSGILSENAKCVIGPGVVVNPFVLLKELKQLKDEGWNLPEGHLVISSRAHILMPYHERIDALQEESLGKLKIGTTKNGIGPCYSDKYTRIGLRMCDLADWDVFCDKLKYILEIKNKEIVNVYGGEPFDYDALLKQFEEIKDQITPMICDTVSLVNEYLDADKNVLFEGAQANMLDINYGSYPYVTSSSPTAAGVCEGAGVSPRKLDRIIGISKAYATRVGEGPYITEEFGPIADDLRAKGGEYGAVTGRPRRLGWMDLPVLKQAVRINGLTDIAITKLDILTGLDKIPVCVAYDLNGEQIDYVPASMKVYGSVKPVYKYFDGWKEDISNIRKYEDLPKQCQDYIEFLEEYLGTSISMVCVSPERTGNIIRKELL